jgi:hypothetical protein
MNIILIIASALIVAALVANRIEIYKLKKRIKEIQQLPTNEMLGARVQQLEETVASLIDPFAQIDSPRNNEI